MPRLASRDRRLKLAVGLALAALTLVVFLPVINHGFINLDDGEYVSRNPRVLAGLTRSSVSWAFTSLGYQANWHPLTWLSHMLDAELFGLYAGGHHLTSLLLHAASAVLLFLALARGTGAVWPSSLAAALFAVHPLHVESVAWVAERKDVLSGLLWMLVMLAYLAYVRRPGPGRYLAVLLLFALGLMAKPMLVTLPLVLLLLDWWPLGRMGTGKMGTGTVPLRGTEPVPILTEPVPILLEKLPLLLLSAASAVISWRAQAVSAAVVPLGEFTLAMRLSNALASYGVYLRKAVWPSGLAVYYPHPEGNLPAAPVVLGAAALAVLSLAAWRLRRRRPYLLAGWLWYLGTLVPVIGLIQVGYQGMADRYTYLPLTGVFIMAAWAASSARARRVPAVAALCLAAVVALAAAARVQVGYWGDNLSLFTQARDNTERNWLAEYNLGLTFAQRGRFDEAREHYIASLAIKPEYADTHNNMGNVYYRRGLPAEAEGYYRRAISLRPGSPVYAFNLGLALMAQNRLEEAVASFRESLGLEPGNADAHNNLAVALGRLGRYREATAHYREALRLKPGYQQAWHNLGLNLFRAGDFPGAAEALNEAVRLDPADADALDSLRKAVSLMAGQGAGGGAR